MSLSAGTGIIDVTPIPPVQIFGAPKDSLAAGIDTNLYVKAVVIEDGSLRIAIVTVDQNKFPPEQTNPARQAVTDATGIPIVNVAITASHTHRAPFYTYYPDSLITPIVQAVQLAIADLAPVTLIAGTGTVTGLQENRRIVRGGTTWGVWQLPASEQHSFPKEGPEDPDFVILGMVEQGGLYKCILYDFACAAANSLDTTLVSGDFPADTENYVRAQLGYDVPCLYLTGVSGDTNPVSTNKLTPRPKLEFGETLGAEILRVLATAVEPVSNPALAMETWELQIPVREAPFFAHDDIMLKWPGQFQLFQDSYNAQIAIQQPSYPCFVSGIRLGDNFAISMNFADLFLQYRLNIKIASPFKYTMVVEHTNGDRGYVPTVIAFSTTTTVGPGGGYETWYGAGNYLHTDTGNIIESNCLAILDNLVRPSIQVGIITGVTGTSGVGAAINNLAPLAPQSLYPITTVPLDQTMDVIRMDNGSLTLIPITILASSLTSFVVTMASMAQDFSLRVWLSQKPHGLAIGRIWNANRTADHVCVLYTPDMHPPENVIGVPVEVGGSYYINILNLTATENAFKFDMKPSITATAEA